MSLLVDIDLSVPLSPHFEGSEHATLTAHVTESSLTGSGGTRATDSWDTCDGTTSSPGLSGVLLTSLVVDTMGLTSVLGHVGVNKLDGIVTDWCGEDGGHSNLLQIGRAHV